MLRRVLKRKQADRVLWLSLFLLTLLGVGVALKLSLNAEKSQARWVGGEPPASELEQNPLAPSTARSASSGATPRESLDVAAAKSDSLSANSPTPTESSSVNPAAPLGVERLTTPSKLSVAAMTPTCRAAIQARGPWSDRRTAQPLPECLDQEGAPMVVQFCSYARLTTGEWVLSENSRTVPRCQEELPLVRQGKVRGTTSP